MINVQEYIHSVQMEKLKKHIQYIYLYPLRQLVFCLLFFIISSPRKLLKEKLKKLSCQWYHVKKYLRKAQELSVGTGLIDKKGERVLFAEAGKDFIDFLFTLLTLPIVTAIKPLNNQGMVGCLGKLYQSVSDLSNDYMQSNQLKDSVLQPKSSFSSHQVPLLPLDQCSTTPPTTQTTFYKCGNVNCNHSLLLSPTCRSCPYCGTSMSKTVTHYVPRASSGAPVPAATVGEVVGFVKGVVTYMVMDDLVVAPMSTISSITMLNKFNIKEVGALEEMVVDVGMDEGLKLLKHALCSKKVLTDVFLGSKG